MAIALVQQTTLGSNGSATSVATGAFATAPTVGNYVIAWAWVGSKTGANWASTAFSCTDNFSNSYSSIGFSASGNTLVALMYYAKVATTGSAFTVTLTASNRTKLDVVAAEFSGLVASSPTDNALGTTGTTGAPAPGSMTLFNAGDLVIAVMASAAAANPATVTTPSGFTAVATQTNGSTFSVGQAIYAINPGSPTNPTWNSGTVAWGAYQAALLAAAAGGPAPAYPAILLACL